MGLPDGRTRWRVLVVGRDATALHTLAAQPSGPRQADVTVVSTVHEAAALLDARPDLVVLAVDPRDDTFAVVEARARALGIPAFVSAGERRRWMDEELRRSEANLATAQRIAKLGSWDFDIATRRLRWSAQVFEMLGYDTAFEPTFDDYLAHVHPDDRDRLSRARQQALDGGPPVAIEYRVVPRRGAPIIVRTAGEVRRDDAGRPLGLTGTVQDITERRAADAALLKRRARLRQSLRRLHALSARVDQIREQERARIARDLHDQLGQALTALKMDVGELRRRLHAGDTAGVEQRLSEMGTFIDASVLDLRRVAHELRPALLDDLGLLPALQVHVAELQRRTGLVCTLAARVDEALLTPERAAVLFRVVQEALTNVVRHARASHADVVVTVTRARRHASASVQDDGCGLPAKSQRNPSGVGLTMMRDRVQLLGGRVLVTRRRAGGTRVAALLPLESGR
jgi:PAS domain S-box-containing protein